jgi:hypothetical protein
MTLQTLHPESSQTPSTFPADADPRLRSDLKTLSLFIDMYCRHKHPDQPRRAVELGGFDIDRIAGKSIQLCPACTHLLQHAFVKRSHCPMSPKPSCKHCTDHCYHPTYRAAIREVMRYSGRKMLLGGRLDYLLHLLF